jgi:hypothetical protein
MRERRQVRLELAKERVLNGVRRHAAVRDDAIGEEPHHQHRDGAADGDADARDGSRIAREAARKRRAGDSRDGGRNERRRPHEPALSPNRLGLGAPPAGEIREQQAVVRAQRRFEREKDAFTLDRRLVDGRPRDEHPRAARERRGRVVLAEGADAEMDEDEPVRRALELHGSNRIAAVGGDRDGPDLH